MTFRNLAQLRQSIARRLRQALEELAGLRPLPQPVRVPVPAPVPRRCLQQCLHKLQRRCLLTFHRRLPCVPAPAKPQRLVKSPAVTQIYNRDWRPHTILTGRFVPKLAQTLGVPTVLRVNISLGEPVHQLILNFAKSDPALALGCYVDFSVGAPIFIPPATVMGDEVVAELLGNLKAFERAIADVRRDLARLSELGELPMRYLESAQTIRVYFPNCDRMRLEALLADKNVLGGVIYEDFEHEADSVSTSLVDLDLLSLLNSLVELYEELEVPPEKIVRLGEAPEPGAIEVRSLSEAW